MARVTRRPDEAVVDDDSTTDARVTEPAYVDTVDAADGHVIERDTAVAPATMTGSEVRDDMLAREQAEFGGMRFGSAFFGWLTALGTGVLLTAIVAAIGTAAGLADDDTVVSARGLGVVGVIAVAIVMFLAYLAGGYVAGRMARFSGARQGFAVWLWAIIAAVVLGLLAVVLGARFDVLATLDAFPRIPLTGDDLTVTGVITAVAFAVISLVGAILGGLAGMRYHRRVDRVGLDGDLG